MVTAHDSVPAAHGARRFGHVIHACCPHHPGQSIPRTNFPRFLARLRELGFPRQFVCSCSAQTAPLRVASVMCRVRRWQAGGQRSWPASANSAAAASTEACWRWRSSKKASGQCCGARAGREPCRRSDIAVHLGDRGPPSGCGPVLGSMVDVWRPRPYSRRSQTAFREPADGRGLERVVRL